MAELHLSVPSSAIDSIHEDLKAIYTERGCGFTPLSTNDIGKEALMRISTPNVPFEKQAVFKAR